MWQFQQVRRPQMKMKSRKSVRDCALFLLEYGDRTEKEMRQKLKEREYDPQEIEDTLRFLKEYHYIDDAEYAGKYIRVNASRKSTRQIRSELEKKGVDRATIDLRLEESPIDEEAQIRAWLKKKGYFPGAPMDPVSYRKVTGALGRRGFTYDAIRRATQQMFEEGELKK